MNWRLPDTEVLWGEGKTGEGGNQVQSESHSVVSTLCDPVDCSLPGSSVHGMLQARVLEWVAILFSRGSS